MNIRREVLAAIRAHAEREHPRECCGILLAAGDEIVEAVAAENIAADPLRRYEVSPADHLSQIRRCRSESGGSRIVGVYHSHPHSSAVPSVTDLEQAWTEYVYVIAGPSDGSAEFAVRAFGFDGSAFQEIALATTPAGGE
jgi:proteasome lid subunit RPN8/RPN11